VFGDYLREQVIRHEAGSERTLRDVLKLELQRSAFGRMLDGAPLSRDPQN
jgi:hypothetical protein